MITVGQMIVNFLRKNSAPFDTIPSWPAIGAILYELDHLFQNDPASAI
jgi:hypothetical protein